MKKIKSYTGIWNVEKVIYSINDFNLPIPLTISQLSWGVSTLMIMIVCQNIPPFSWVDNYLLKYFVIPIAITWLMSQKTFDGKKPYSYLKAKMFFTIRSKKTFGGKKIKLKNLEEKEGIIIVRSENYVPD